MLDDQLHWMTAYPLRSERSDEAGDYHANTAAREAAAGLGLTG